VSFDAADRGGTALRIDGDYVERTLGVLARDEDLSRYIL
jgi:ATP-dependent HslUV protease ATP-binding subunit HslU